MKPPEQRQSTAEADLVPQRPPRPRLPARRTDLEELPLEMPVKNTSLHKNQSLNIIAQNH